MMRNFGKILIVAGAAAALAGVAARAEPLIADLSTHVIEITSGFSGAEILLFGTADEDGQVVIAVIGPSEDVVVRRKERVAGIWINRTAVTFTGVPAYYSLSTSVPLVEIAEPAVFAELGIRPGNLNFAPAHEISAQDFKEFSAALIRNKETAQLYRTGEGAVTFVKNELFRTQIRFPANAPTGTYSADVYLFRYGQLVSRQSTPLFISKSGIERAVYELANDQPAIYGILAIILAVAGGWIAAAVFRWI